jgi:F-type H+-transporting ATPase subunit epsilon
MMHVKILLPSSIFLEQEVHKIVAEGLNGSFCLLPRHIDYTNALVPGILTLESVDGEVTYHAVSEGIVVKIGKQVLISVRDAVRGDTLEDLKKAVDSQFIQTMKQEAASRAALKKLEADTIRRFMELGEKSK